VTLTECVLLGNTGADIDLKFACGLLCELVSETPGRVIVSVDDRDELVFRELCAKHEIPVHMIGRTVDEPRLMIRAEQEVLDFTRQRLQEAYQSTDSIFPPGKAAALAH